MKFFIFLALLLLSVNCSAIISEPAPTMPVVLSENSCKSVDQNLTPREIALVKQLNDQKASQTISNYFTYFIFLIIAGIFIFIIRGFSI
jgi:uncharacterized membrane protein SpoIIM required for sporulation